MDRCPAPSPQPALAALWVSLVAAALVVPTEGGMVMPVNDDLLARADRWLTRWERGYAMFDEPEDRRDVAELLDELRAALAAQPQADEVANLREFVAAHDAVEELVTDCTDDRDAYNAAVQRLDQARLAVAGSATPTTETDDG